MGRVFTDRFETADELRHTVDRALEWVGTSRLIRPGDRVFIKPNLTWKVPTPGVTTTPEAIRATVEALLPYTRNITIGESNGGQDCFWAEDAFRSHGLYDLADEFGIKVVNLSKQPTAMVRTTVRGKTF